MYTVYMNVCDCSREAEEDLNYRIVVIFDRPGDQTDS